MASPRRPSNQGLVIQTSAGIYDLSGEYAAATPTPTGIIDTRNVPGRNSPLRTPTRVDLSYELAGFLDGTGGEARAIRSAAIAGETIKLLEHQSDNKHWWLSSLLIPQRADEDGDLLTFSWTMPSDGEPWMHGVLLNNAAGNQAKTNVPAGAVAMIAILSVGNLTNISLTYTSGGTDYSHTISTPAVGIVAASLLNSTNEIPAAASSGNFVVAKTPVSGNTADLLIGYGVKVYED